MVAWSAEEKRKGAASERSNRASGGGGGEAETIFQEKRPRRVLEPDAMSARLFTSLCHPLPYVSRMLRPCVPANGYPMPLATP